MKARSGLIVTLTTLSLIMGCASSPYVGTGALLGGGLGAAAGAAIGHSNPWQGAVIGGLAGSALGAAGGWALQQGQTSQPQQGYYYPAQPGSSAVAPPGYGYGAPAPGSAPHSVYSSTWTSVDPQGPQGSAAPPPKSYSQTPPPRDPGIRAPLTNGPYYPEE
jgi:hypothetical protein